MKALCGSKVAHVADVFRQQGLGGGTDCSVSTYSGETQLVKSKGEAYGAVISILPSQKEQQWLLFTESYNAASSSIPQETFNQTTKPSGFFVVAVMLHCCMVRLHKER